jgi:hypothetical protein
MTALLRTPLLASRPPGDDDPIGRPMVIAACSARKTATTSQVPAFELYQGGCVPPLRERVGHDPRLRGRVRFLSAEHGIIGADTLLLPYDRALDPRRAAELRPAVTRALVADFTKAGFPRQVLVIAEPTYLILLADLLAAGIPMHWVPDVRAGWAEAAAVLDGWGWP